jgi:hypothetical protein
MASRFARNEIIKARLASSAVSHALAHLGVCGLDEITGRFYDFSAKRADRNAGGIALPAPVREAIATGSSVPVPPWVRDAYDADRMGEGSARDEALGRAVARLWSEAQRMELLEDGSRYRHGAQLARSETLALPRELGPALRLELLGEWIERSHTSRGLAVTWSSRQLVDDESDNPHAILTISTRLLLAAGFDRTKAAAKAGGPVFRGGSLFIGDPVSERWTEAQLAFARERGIGLEMPAVQETPARRKPYWECLKDDARAAPTAP